MQALGRGQKVHTGCFPCNLVIVFVFAFVFVFVFGRGRTLASSASKRVAKVCLPAIQGPA